MVFVTKLLHIIDGINYPWDETKHLVTAPEKTFYILGKNPLPEEKKIQQHGQRSIMDTTWAKNFHHYCFARKVSIMTD